MLCYRIKFTFCSFVIKHVQHSTRDKIQIHTSAYSNSFPRFTMQVSPTILCDSRFSSYTCMVKTRYCHCLLILHSISKASSFTKDLPFGIKITMVSRVIVSNFTKSRWHSSCNHSSDLSRCSF